MIDILLIEDELIIAQDIKLSLGLNNFAAVEIAKNVVQARDVFDEKNFDVIISDVQLNETKDGIDIIEELNSDNQIPVIFLTAYSDKNTIARIEAIKAAAYLLKPYNINQLKATINLALQNHDNKLKLSILSKDDEIKLNSLTNREKEILQILSSGKTSKEIASNLHISVNTVEQHKKNIKKKLKLNTIGELVSFALKIQ